MIAETANLATGMGVVKEGRRSPIHLSSSKQRCAGDRDWKWFPGNKTKAAAV